jgi:hypothetical protein
MFVRGDLDPTLWVVCEKFGDDQLMSLITDAFRARRYDRWADLCEVAIRRRTFDQIEADLYAIQLVEWELEARGYEFPSREIPAMVAAYAKAENFIKTRVA